MWENSRNFPKSGCRNFSGKNFRWNFQRKNEKEISQEFSRKQLEIQGEKEEVIIQIKYLEPFFLFFKKKKIFSKKEREKKIFNVKKIFFFTCFSSAVANKMDSGMAVWDLKKKKLIIQKFFFFCTKLFHFE